MRRIGIVSMYYQVRNYGAALQSYALWRIVARCRQISYNRFDSHKTLFQQGREYLSQGRFLRLLQKINTVAYRGLRSHFQPDLETRYQLFDRFLEEIPHTRPYTEDTIGECLGDFDILICGSDQIWNPDMVSDVFTLDFAPETPKIAYAASIGKSCADNGYLKSLAQKIRTYQAVSLRESTFLEPLSAFSGKQIVHVLDPTMLLDRENYLELCEPPLIAKPFAFLYLLGGKRSNLRYAKKIAAEEGLSVAYLPCVGDYGFHDEKHGDFTLSDVGPREFLTLIRDADLVITDSFHATVFSILFHKRFYCLPRDSDSSRESMNGRLTTLLESLDLRERMISPGKASRLPQSVSYECADEKLDNLRRKSLDFLSGALRDASETRTT